MRHWNVLVKFESSGGKANEVSFVRTLVRIEEVRGVRR